MTGMGAHVAELAACSLNQVQPSILILYGEFEMEKPMATKIRICTQVIVSYVGPGSDSR